MVDFARHRGWLVRDGQIFFPAAAAAGGGGGSGGGGEAAAQQDGPGPVTADKAMSQMIIENALGYARELETIV